LGLATEPQRLLAKEAVAQSHFDLANAQLLVHDAQAQMAIALGIPADQQIKVVGLEAQAAPPLLSQSVEAFIADARRERPDLASSVASLRASEAGSRLARAQFFPVAGLSAGVWGNLLDVFVV